MKDLQKITSLLIIINSILMTGGNFTACAQEETFMPSNVVIYKDSRIDSLILQAYPPTDDRPQINGYRVQVYSGPNQKEALKAKVDFLHTYENINIYIDYRQPNYIVRAGDFRTRYEAQKLYHILLDDTNFSAVLIVPDKIYLPDL